MTDLNKERELYNRMRYLVFSLYVGEKAQRYEKARTFIDFLCEKHFVGCRDNKVTRYLVAIDVGTCDDKRISVLRDSVALAKVALSSAEAKNFSFHELDDEIFEPSIQ